MDTYISSSLKEQTRKKRSGPDPIEYSISDTMSLKGIPLKNCLAHPHTKHDLTEYLCRGLIAAVPISEKRIVVGFKNRTEANHPDLEFNETCHEEADTLIPLHVLAVCQQAEITRTSRIDVWSKDTDVYVYLMHLVATKQK